MSYYTSYDQVWDRSLSLHEGWISKEKAFKARLRISDIAFVELFDAQVVLGEQSSS